MRYKRELNYKIWYLAWPMIISNISVPLLGLVDTAILGHLENATHLGAVAIGGSILSFLYWGFGFLRMGTTGLTAQAFGANAHNQSRLILVQAIVLGFSLGIVIIVFSPLLLKLGLYWITPPKDSYEHSLTYSTIRIFSAPAVLINYSIIGWLIGRQNTLWPLLITIISNIINLILDCLFILGLDMKSEGAAFATLIAEYCGCAIAIWVIQKKLIDCPGQIKPSQLWKIQKYKELILVNRHLFVRTLTLLGALAFFTSQGAKQGEIILAANTLIMNLLLLTSFGLDGFAHAAESLVGNAAGKKNRELFLQTCIQCAQWSIITALLFTVIFVLLGDNLLSILTSIKDVKVQASIYLPWLFVLPFIAVWSYLLDGIFIGTTQTSAMQTSMLASVVIIYLPCWYFTQHWGNNGLWFAFISFTIARGVSLGWYFYHYSSPWQWWRERPTD